MTRSAMTALAAALLLGVAGLLGACAGPKSTALVHPEKVQGAPICSSCHDAGQRGLRSRCAVDEIARRGRRPGPAHLRDVPPGLVLRRLPRQQGGDQALRQAGRTLRCGHAAPGRLPHPAPGRRSHGSGILLPVPRAQERGEVRHMSQVRRRSAVFAVGCALLALLAVGCSKKNGVAFDPDAGHPDDFFPTHPAEYRNSAGGCAPCHGTDLLGGISTVSCYSSSRDGQGCHADGPGGHPAGWRALHSADPSKAATCAPCHDNPSNNLAPNCFDNSLCHGPKSGHPPGWRSAHSGADPAQASYLRRLPPIEPRHARLLQQHPLPRRQECAPRGLAADPHGNRSGPGLRLRQMPRQPVQQPASQLLQQQPLPRFEGRSSCGLVGGEPARCGGKVRPRRLVRVSVLRVLPRLGAERWVFRTILSGFRLSRLGGAAREKRLGWRQLASPQHERRQRFRVRAVPPGLGAVERFDLQPQRRSLPRGLNG